ncbi:hypothetical protein [Tritonibacter litoralis]|nr:hypothetical protein [Tritonibacter litoralis]
MMVIYHNDMAVTLGRMMMLFGVCRLDLFRVMMQQIAISMGVILGRM